MRRHVFENGEHLANSVKRSLAGRAACTVGDRDIVRRYNRELFCCSAEFVGGLGRLGRKKLKTKADPVVTGLLICHQG
jgi:hypothetical protein